MGLNTSHGAWDGPYSSFNDFRRWLAKQIGINLKDYAGYMDGGTKDLTTIDHPLMPLFNHSDCDGILTPDECRQISKGLKMIIENCVKSRENEYFIEAANQFRKGCIKAANAKENLEFH